MDVHSSHKMPNPLYKNPNDENRHIREYPRCEKCKKFLALERPCPKAPKHRQRNGNIVKLTG